MRQALAGAAVALLLTTGTFLFWQGHAANTANSGLPAAPTTKLTAPGSRLFALAAVPEMPDAPEASPKTREEKRFSRADKDKDGKLTSEELLMPRHKAFAKLDIDHNGMLSFNEWAAKTINKFAGADDDHSGWLTAAEYAETAPKPRKHVRCAA